MIQHTTVDQAQRYLPQMRLKSHHTIISQHSFPVVMVYQNINVIHQDDPNGKHLPLIGMVNGYHDHLVTLVSTNIEFDIIYIIN